MTNKLPKWYTTYKNLIEKSTYNYLEDYFQSESNTGLDNIKEASLYAVKGGKRIRSILALEFYLTFTDKDISEVKEDDDIIKFCIALELLHAYSLVHDDMPCMDNDEYRRGELTVWKKYSEAAATLTGDLLNSLAFEVISEVNNKGDYAVIANYFGQAVGLKGMIGGQVLDLYYENNPDELTLEVLEEVHNKKTGALIEVSVLGGLLIAGKSKNIDSYIDFGKKIGLAFQVKDDLLDVEGSFEETGKSVGGEDKGFVYFLGVDKTREYLNKLIDECDEIIKELNSDKLTFLTSYIKNRKK